MDKIPPEVPKSDAEAVEWLSDIALDAGTPMAQHSASKFLRAWRAVAFLYPGLHPDEAGNHGDVVIEADNTLEIPSGVDPRFVFPYFEKSGWPVILKELSSEAIRRRELGNMGDEDFYPLDALLAGVQFRSTLLETER